MTALKSCYTIADAKQRPLFGIVVRATNATTEYVLEDVPF
jgi:hypothetical protein